MKKSSFVGLASIILAAGLVCACDEAAGILSVAGETQTTLTVLAYTSAEAYGLLKRKLQHTAGAYASDWGVAEDGA
ncbi:MAG: hypothetical protein LBB22_03285 [Treponema sp.]|jgi:hypothetical protein|nr:hypothetical protein [Treponema sp.]